LTLLGVDVGTTHCKVCLCEDDGSVLQVVREPTPIRNGEHGLPYHPPAALWLSVASAIRSISKRCDAAAIRAIGVASMAEAGLLVDARTGAPRTEIIPWYDARSIDQAHTIEAADEPLSLFRRTGLHPSFTYGLAKILWLRNRQLHVVDGAVWLSVADYIVFRLTGVMATDPTLAARTYVYSLIDGAWDDEWIRHFGLAPLNFPPIVRTGEPVGAVHDNAASFTGLMAGARVAIGGHDHICASLAVGLVKSGIVVDSIGTAESMLGMVDRFGQTETEFDSGLALVPHVLPNRFCWLGGTRSAGGSVEWLTRQFAGTPMSYDNLLRLVAEAGEDPTRILFFPYLLGTGGVCRDDEVRAAFVGLSASHIRAHLFKAVLEGTAYESESIRRAAERLTDTQIDELIVVGGGANSLPWVQIKADVTGCPCVVPDIGEATALGAAIVAGGGCGVFASEADMISVAQSHKGTGSTIHPNLQRHDIYRRLYETGYEPVGKALRHLTRDMKMAEEE
jgi:sugar (pentulose or hexulose) kinase